MDIKVKIDNEEVLFEYMDGNTLKEDQKPYMPKDENGDTIYRVLVPIRYPFEQLGFDVNWEDRDLSNGYKGKAIASNRKGNILSAKSKIKSKLYDVSIKEGDAFCETNGEEHEYIDDVVPVFTGGRTCLPMRTVFESIDCFVDWDSANSTVVVYSLKNYYRIKNQDGKYLTYESTDNDTRILVKNKDNDNPYSQVWKIERSPEDHRHHIRATQNVNRGINIYHGNNTCTIYNIDGNIPDTSFTIDNAPNATEVGECVISWADDNQILYLGEGESGAIFQADNTQHWILELASTSNNPGSNPADIEGYYKIKNDSGYITYSVSESSQKPTASNTILSVNAGNLDNANLQIWKIEKNTNSNKYFIRPALSTYLGMNVYGISNNPCTLQPTSTYPDDTSFSIEYVENQGYLIFWENNNVRYYLAEGNGTIGESGKVYWQAETQYLWTLEPTSYTPPPVDDTKSYPVAGIVHQGTTYVGHQPDSRDFAAPAGTAIYATMAGIVTDVVMKYSNDYNYNSSTGISTGGATSEICDKMASYGNYVMIKVDCDKSILIFAHQQQNSYVKINDRVSVGQQIGEVGNTGVSTGSHLHFQLRKKETEENTVLDYFLWDY